MFRRATTRVLLLLCAMYFITYVDRVNVSTAASQFGAELHLSHTQIGFVFSAFAYPYLVFQIIRRMGGGPLRAASHARCLRRDLGGRDDHDRAGWRVCIADRCALVARAGRRGDIPDRYPRNVELDACRSTRFRTRNHACRVAHWQCGGAAVDRLVDDRDELAWCFHRDRDREFPVGGRLDLLFPR